MATTSVRRLQLHPTRYNWDSTTVGNGAHSITAQATNSEGVTTTSASEEVTVDNVIALGTNLVPNPLVETANPSNSATPLDWQTGNWGTNTTSFSYLKSGSTGDTNSLNVNTTSYTSGDAKWYFNPVSITAGAQYTFSDYYESTIASEIDVAYSMSGGTTEYVDLGDPAASPSWQNFTASFTAPSGAISATVYDLIGGVGSLTTDNFSLAPTSTPEVVVASPAANSSVSGTSVQLLANAADTSGIKSVQFQIDGVNVGSALTTSPYDYTWDSTTVANGTHQITAIATNNLGITTTSAAVAVVVNNVVSAGTNIIPNPLLETANPSNANNPLDWIDGTYGTNSTTFSYLKTGSTGDNNSVNVKISSYTSGSSEWMFNAQAVNAGQTYNFSDYYESTIATNVEVEFISTGGTYSYLSLGSPAASSSWKQFTGSFTVPAGTASATVYQYLNAVGSLTTDNYTLSASTLPSVTITAPTASSTSYSGNVTLSASASDNSGITSVQFMVDGVNVGAADTTAPYSYVWNSASVANGAHNISATVTANDGKTATASAVTIQVSNTNPASGNLIPNPLLTTVNPSNSAEPEDWSVATWGTNTFTQSYNNTGSTGDSRSVEINMTKYTSGDAKWTFTPQAVSQDTQYDFSDYYESNVQTQVDAVFTMSDGSTEYEIIGIPYAASTWTEFSSKFSVPAGAQTVTIYHLIQSVGTLSIDNTSLTTYVPTGFSRPLVTITFDDGYVTAYTNASPILKADGLTSTDFIITDEIGQTGYMTAAELKTLTGYGDEMASHTVTHDNLTLETASQLKTEMTESQATLKTDTGVTTTDMAYPYGLYNAAVVSATKAVYGAARGVESGLNSKDNYNAYDLKVEDVYTTTTTAQITDWLAQAKATNTWLIFVYHGVDTNLNDPVDGDEYCVTPTQLTAQMAAVKASGITVETMAKAIAEVTPQL